MKKLAALCALVVALSGCAHRAATPRVDHHQHLLSPAGALLLADALPPTALPDDVARLLVERQTRWNDKGALAELYTEDSVVLSTEAPNWLEGRDAVADYLSGRFARPFRITPVLWRDEGAWASLSGYFTRGEGESVWHFGTVHLQLKKDAGGRWRIASEIPAFPGPSKYPPVDAAQLVKALDEAGIERGVVLSSAFFFDSRESKTLVDPVAKMRAENDWTAAQAARFPERIVAFCSFNPLKSHALGELERCAANPVFKGVKLHFQESGVDVLNADHVAKVRQVFETANRHRLPIIAHVATSGQPPYGRAHAEAIVKQLLPAAPDVAVVIAHFWGGGPYSDEAMNVYGEAVASGRNLYFEISGTVLMSQRSAETLAAAAKQIRAIGADRFLFGSDFPDLHGQTLPDIWPEFRQRVPLSEEELRTIANNVAPFLRD